MNKALESSLLAIFYVVFASIGSCTTVLAFDTGHHQDVTRAALNHGGFNEDAIEIVQAENWLTDYYAGIPRNPLNGQPLSKLTPAADKLHFDNLFTTGDVKSYWAQFAVNTKSSVEQATRDKSNLELLAIIGVSLHTVQDFYAHSNWVLLHPQPSDGSFGSETWFNSPIHKEDSVFTGKGGSYVGIPPFGSHVHGDYHDPPTGDLYLNRDSYVRPLWAQAYVYSYAASIEWINAIHQWIAAIDPKVWSDIRHIAISPTDKTDLDADLNATLFLSEWTYHPSSDPNQNHNGNWKGDGSGSSNAFYPLAFEYFTKRDSIFVSVLKTKNVFQRLSAGLYGVPSAISTVSVPSVNSVCQAIMISTLEINVRSLGAADAGVRLPNLYTRVTVDGQTFRDAPMRQKPGGAPAWTALKFLFLTSPVIVARYELWDEHSDGNLPDVQLMLYPLGNTSSLNFNIDTSTGSCSGNLTGVHSNAANPAVVNVTHGNQTISLKLLITLARVK